MTPAPHPYPTKSVAEEILLDGPASLGAASVSAADAAPESPLVTNFSIDPVMTRNPSYKQIIKICSGLNGKLQNEIHVKTSFKKIKMQLIQILQQLIIITDLKKKLLLLQLYYYLLL